MGRDDGKGRDAERAAARERQRRRRERLASGAAPALCGATTRTGGTCRRPAGAGTDHLGSGCCRLHAGATPSHEVKAAREQALAEARAVAPEAIIEMDPARVVVLSASLAADRLARFRETHADALAAGRVDLVRIEGELLDRAARLGRLATAEDFVERQRQMVERVSDRIVAAAETAIAKVGLTVEQRTVFAKAFGARLALLEGDDDDQVVEGLEVARA